MTFVLATFSVIVKTDCETDGSFYSTTSSIYSVYLLPSQPPLHLSMYPPQAPPHGQFQHQPPQQQQQEQEVQPQQPQQQQDDKEAAKEATPTIMFGCTPVVSVKHSSSDEEAEPEPREQQQQQAGGKSWASLFTPSPGSLALGRLLSAKQTCKS